MMNRVKAIDILAVATPSGPRPWTTIMSSISSDGWIRIFDIGQLSERLKLAEGKEVPQITSIASYDTKGTRLTCCALADGEAVALKVTGKRKGDFEDDDDEILLEGDVSKTGDGDEEDGDAQKSEESDLEADSDAEE